MPIPVCPADDCTLSIRDCLRVTHSVLAVLVDLTHCTDSFSNLSQSSYVSHRSNPTPRFTVLLQEAASASPGLGNSDIDAIGKWRYAPATFRGKPVPVETVFEVIY